MSARVNCRSPEEGDVLMRSLLSLRRARRTVLVLVCALAGVLGVGVGSAGALLYHRYEAQIAGGGAMAFDGGDLLVDEGSRLAEYDGSSDALLAQLSSSSLGLSGLTGIAAGSSGGETQMYARTGEDIAVLGVGACGTVECATVKGQWSGAGTPAGSFFPQENGFTALFDGVAVDNSTSASDWAKGDVFVATSWQYRGQGLGTDVVDVFKPADSANGYKEEYVMQINTSSLGGESFEPEGFAVSEVNGDVIVDNAGRSVDVFEPTGLGEYTLAYRLTGPNGNASFEKVGAVAAAGGSGLGAGDIFVADREKNVVYEFGAGGEMVARIEGTPSGAFTGPGGVVVDPVSGRVFVGDSAIDVFSGDLVVPDTTMEGVAGAKYDSQSGTWTLDLTGSVNPDGAGPATCRFAWGSTPALGNQAACEGPGESAADPVANGMSPVGVQAQISGLAPDTTYYYRLQASNENGPNEGEESQDAQFTTNGPGISEESASSVTATSATLNAVIDPNNNPTTYYFQYGTSASYGQSVPLPPGVALGSSKGDLNVSVQVQGLVAGTVYHYRVVAVGESGGETVPVLGSDETFTTQQSGGEFNLPDGREWEMVSPPDKHGALILPIRGEGVIQASVVGNAVTYITDAPTEADPDGYSNYAQALSTRGPSGWSTHDIAIPHETATGQSVGLGQEYRFFSEDLSLAVVQPFGSFDPSVSPEASEQTPYLRTNYLDENVNDPCVEGCYRPLVTGKPGFANVPEGTVFGESSITYGGSHDCPPNLICGPEFVDATPDLSHIFLSSSAKLTAEESSSGIYEWAQGKLKASSPTSMPSPRVLTSEDGSWVYFFSGEILASGAVAGGPNLYVRHGGTTKLVATLSPGDREDNYGGPLNHLTMRVSPNGRWLAFMSQRELTGYDTHDAVSGKPDEEVYLYDAEGNGGSGKLVCASCDPSGARPVGVENESINFKLVGGINIWPGNQGIAANIPGWTPYKLNEVFYQSRYLSDSGRLFFNSDDALVPQDVNGTEDVYEFEPVGVGDCKVSNPNFSERSDGCVGLISSGTSAEESAFMDASGSGGDVFFLTAAKLSPQDDDTALDMYDAHECTSAEPCFPAPAVQPPACSTEASCRAAPTPQPTIFGLPSSATFAGTGNLTPTNLQPAVKARSLTRAQKLARALKACRKKRGRGRDSCKRQADARYGSRTNLKSGRRG
jgi:hypothetical protein